MKEVEAFGLNYERFALHKKIKEFVKKYNIKTVLEIPAHGVKAAPSLYSLGFALEGCSVTLLNGDKNSLKYYRDLGVEKRVKFLEVKNITNTSFPSDSFDYVWNFAYIPEAEDKVAIITEMKRVSRKFIALFSVNGRNVGFPMHKLAHKLNNIPWTHGDTRYNSPHFIQKFLRHNKLRIIENGVVDCPIWPDSVGFRDIRLHKANKKFDHLDWEVPYVDYLKSGKIPNWIKLVYLAEKLPLPLFLKYPYAHIMYSIAKK